MFPRTLTYSTLSSKAGQAAIWAIAVSALMAIPLGMMSVSLLREAKITNARRHRLAAAKESQEYLLSELHKIESGALPSHSQAKTLTLTHSPSRLLAIDSSAKFNQARQTTSVLISLSAIKTPSDWRPHWGKLRSSGSLTVSDVKSSKPLRVSGRNETLRFGTAGDLTLSGGLLITRSRNIKAEIIAAGSISIESIQVEKSGRVQLILHSSTGKIQIGNLSEGVTLCHEENDFRIVQLTLEAPESISVSGKKYEDEFVIGCKYEKDPIYWPKMKLLGEWRS